MRIKDLSEQWVADSLGVDVGRVGDVRYEPLGTGQVADTYRVSFDLEGGERRSLVLKVTSENRVSAATGRRERNYLREVRYYQTLAPSLDISVPACLRAEIDDDGLEFALLLEDLAPCRPGDQLLGCTVDEAATVLSEAAKLHAAHWADPTLGNYPWLPPPPEPDPDVLPAVSALFDGFCGRYGDVVDAEILGIGRRLFDRLPQYFALPTRSPWTLQHGDLRPDNLIFDVADSRAVVVVDWQTVQRGPAMVDVSYLLGGCMSPAERRLAERDLLAHYHDQLRRFGVRGYSFDDCWRDYTRFALHGYFVAVSAAMIVKRTDRGDRMFTEMVRRAGRHALDLDAAGNLS